jgi:hypothetical protein
MTPDSWGLASPYSRDRESEDLLERFLRRAISFTTPMT